MILEIIIKINKSGFNSLFAKYTNCVLGSKSWIITIHPWSSNTSNKVIAIDIPIEIIILITLKHPPVFTGRMLYLLLPHERIYPSPPPFCSSIQEIPYSACHIQYPFSRIEYLLVHAHRTHPANSVQDAGSQL